MNSARLDVEEQQKQGTWSGEPHIAALAMTIERPICVLSVDRPDGVVYGPEQFAHRPQVIIRHLDDHFERVIFPEEEAEQEAEQEEEREEEEEEEDEEGGKVVSV